MGSEQLATAQIQFGIAWILLDLLGDFFDLDQQIRVAPARGRHKQSENRQGSTETKTSYHGNRIERARRSVRKGVCPRPGSDATLVRRWLGV
jgi:hypothetical protein